MSSSNSVRVAVIPETVYGETPLVGDFAQARFISESLSGTPETVESQQIRTDRMSSGQIVTGLTVGGDISFELAKESVLESFMESAMYNTWQTQALATVDMDLDVTAKTITRDTGSWSAANFVGDFITLGGFANTVNNTQIMIAEIVSPTVARFVGPDTLVDETGSGTTYKRLDKLSIGTTTKSFSMEKAFLDLTTKAIIYRGMVAANMELNVAFGELVGGSFTWSGSDYETVESAVDFITDGRTITAPATTNTLNGSVDMPFLASSAGGNLDSSAFCIQNVNLSLDNNLNPQQCIGNIAPDAYTPGTAGIEVSITAYLRDTAWDMLDKKLNQDSFSLAFMVKNSGGAYAFYLPAIQVSFDDPQSGGANQDVTLDMSGQAKVGPNGESALTIFRL